MSAVHTYSGLLFDITNPRPELVSVADIAYALARIPRWNGNTTEYWTVADHSIWVAQHLREQGASREMQLAGLLHDAHEAYVSDIPWPVKALFREVLDPVTERIDRVIEKVFGLPAKILRSPDIHSADMIAAATERRHLLKENPHWPWDPNYPPAAVLHPAGSEIPEQSEAAFRGRLSSLWAPETR